MRGVGMDFLVEEGLGAFDRLINQAQERRVDLIIHIAFLEADEASSTEAHTELADIEKLLKTMRRQRALLVASGHPNEAASLQAAA